MTEAKRHIGFMIFIALVILAAGRIYRATRPPTPEELLAPLQDELALFRAAADSCNARYAVTEARFRSIDRRVDSLRALVLRYEGMDPEGVPGDRYPEYLEAFDAYNEAVPVWEARAESVEVEFGRCRLMTEGHNELADSLRRQLVEYGLWPADSAARPGAADPVDEDAATPIPTPEEAEGPPPGGSGGGG